MPNLDSFPPQLNQSRRVQVSRIFKNESDCLPTIFRSKSMQFVPFVNERDSMGRLLLKKKNQFQNTQYLQMSQSQVINYASNDYKDNPENKQKINQAVQLFFKKIDLQQKQLKRSTFSPRKIVLVYDKEKKNPHPSNQDYDITNGIQKIKSRNKSVQLSHFRGQNSLNLVQQQNSSTKLRRFKSQRVSIQTTQQKIKGKNASTPNIKITKQRKKNNEEKSMKVKLNFDHPQLKRYRQLQKLSVKVFPDYQVGHQKFFEKMKQSKKIVYNIKKQLRLQ